MSGLYISSRKTVRYIGLFISVLILFSLIGQISRYVFGKGRLLGFIDLFDVDLEMNIPSLYSTLSLFLCGAILCIIFLLSRLEKDRFANHWKWLSVIFFYLSADELLSIHEGLIEPLRAAFGLSGIFYFSWILVGIILLVFLSVCYFRFLVNLPKQTRKLFLTAAFIYVFGSIGMEMIGGLYASNVGSRDLFYAILVNIEELLEMIGILVFIYALLNYFSSQFGHIKISVKE